MPWVSAIAAAGAIVASACVGASPRPEPKARQIACEGCGACAFDSFLCCTYCRRPRLDPALLANAYPHAAPLPVTYGVATMRPELSCETTT